MGEISPKAVYDLVVDHINTICQNDDPTCEYGLGSDSLSEFEHRLWDKCACKQITNPCGSELGVWEYTYKVNVKDYSPSENYKCKVNDAWSLEEDASLNRLMTCAKSIPAVFVEGDNINVSCSHCPGQTVAYAGFADDKLYVFNNDSVSMSYDSLLLHVSYVTCMRGDEPTGKGLSRDFLLDKVYTARLRCRVIDKTYDRFYCETDPDAEARMIYFEKNPAIFSKKTLRTVTPMMAVRKGISSGSVSYGANDNKYKASCSCGRPGAIDYNRVVWYAADFQGEFPDTFDVVPFQTPTSVGCSLKYSRRTSNHRPPVINNLFMTLYHVSQGGERTQLSKKAYTLPQQQPNIELASILKSKFINNGTNHGDFFQLECDNGVYKGIYL